MDFVERIKFFLESSHAIEIFSQGRELGHCDKNAKNKSTLNSTGTGLSTLVETRSVSGNLRVYFGIVFAFTVSVKLQVLQLCHVASVGNSPYSRELSLVSSSRSRGSVAGSVAATLVLLPYSIGRPRDERERHGFGMSQYTQWNWVSVVRGCTPPSHAALGKYGLATEPPGRQRTSASLKHVMKLGR